MFSLLTSSLVSVLLASSGSATPAPAPAPAPAAVAPAAAASSTGPVVPPPTTPPSPHVRSPFTVATFNALGDSHTRHGGNKRQFASSDKRTRWAIRLFDSYALDVIGLQEFEPPQQSVFAKAAGSVYGHWGPRANGVAWRLSAFDFVSASTLTVPYFHGNPVAMPVVTLRSTVTRQKMTFISVHNPANARGPAQKWRDRAVQAELEHVTALHAEHPRRPVFLLGDMNDHQKFFCHITSTGLIHAAPGGSNGDGPCVFPPFYGIDWITAVQGVEFSDFATVRTPLVERATDHPLVLSRVG